MLIEVKVKVARNIEAKIRKRTEVFVLDREFFAEAEYDVTAALSRDAAVESHEIQSLRVSPIKEVYTNLTGEWAFLATLRETFHADDGTEKALRYKIMLWADSHAEALRRVQELSRQGYDMRVEGIKEVEYEYLHVSTNTQSDTEA